MSTDVITAIKTTRTTKSRLAETDFNNIPFGKVMSDHMLMMDFDGEQWQAPEILPFGPIPMSPASSCLHYGQAIFEGMKAHRSTVNENDIFLFRPQDNAERLNKSAVRMGMPQNDVPYFIKLLAELVRLDHKWVPSSPDSSLYIRPFMISTDPFIGVRPSKTHRLFILTSPSGPYYNEPVRVKAAEKYVRAFPGGTGDVKAAGNYGATMYPSMLAKSEGYHQVLWMDAQEFKYVEEIGTMNVFFVIDDVVVTPKLTGTLLPGVTRDSVIQIFRDMGKTVEERLVSIDELIDANNKGLLQDAFGSGTAATIAPIAEIGYKDTHHTLLPVAKRIYSKLLTEKIEAAKRGALPQYHKWLVKV